MERKSLRKMGEKMMVELVMAMMLMMLTVMLVPAVASAKVSDEDIAEFEELVVKINSNSIPCEIKVPDNGSFIAEVNGTTETSFEFNKNFSYKYDEIIVVKQKTTDETHTMLQETVKLCFADGHIRVYYGDVEIESYYEDSIGNIIEWTGSAIVITNKEILKVAEPVAEPTAKPTKKPEVIITAKPVPTKKPTAKPTKEPTKAPTAKPTKAPEEEPTAEPTKTPTVEPTQTPVEPQNKMWTTTVETTAKPKAKRVAKSTEEPTTESTPEPTSEPTATPAPTPNDDDEVKRPKTGDDTSFLPIIVSSLVGGIALILFAGIMFTSSKKKVIK